tara:strand:+ start:31226 stop:31393 length:168 start_codon:yes stop_codon:yes gene_type:complete
MVKDTIVLITDCLEIDRFSSSYYFSRFTVFLVGFLWIIHFVAGDYSILAGQNLFK